MFFQNIINPLIDSLLVNKAKNAFCINECFYTYDQVAIYVSKIRTAIQSMHIENPNIGLVINDDIETYASIIALWLEGYAYLPLHPYHPTERNLSNISQTKIELILDSSVKIVYSNFSVIETGKLQVSQINLEPKITDDNSLAYILYTSGSTGQPKGVTISRFNLASFVKSFFELDFQIDVNDRCLQCFDLTFDLSVMSYLVPLLKGACVYTIPYNQIKYLYISELLENHQLTIALMVPSTIRNLRPYLSELLIPSMRYSLFCGEALPIDLVEEWSHCVPNAEIDNVYGPTENTIFCSFYRYQRNDINKSYNGILAIGKAMNGGNMIIVNNQNKSAGINQIGELCLSGNQLSPGYWNNPSKNEQMFFIGQDGTRFYKTGDVCFIDDQGDIMYAGRIDYQVKVQGYRVELGEIEYHAQTFLKNKSAVAISFDNKANITEIALFIESEIFDTENLQKYLQKKMPSYMIPTKLLFEPVFPLNSNGKIDRNKLINMVI